MHSTPQTSIVDSPPEPLQVLPEGIPDELKGRPQWVNWKYARHDKKWTKHPYNPRTGRKASTTDLLTWSTFEEVLEAYEAERFDGLGFVLCSGDPFTGIDFDDCRDPETGQVKEWAMEIVELVSAYAEVSPSGRGLHLIVRGVLPNSRRGGVEVYSCSRFFTMTGNIL